MRDLPRSLPVGAFGSVMGLVGLGLTARAAAPLFPGVFRAPAYFTELWIALGVVVFAGLFCLYAAKAVAHRKEVKGEFMSPASLGFCGTLPVAMGLVAGGLAPYLPTFASGLWWTSVFLFAAFFAWGAWRVIGGALFRDVYPAWLVIFVGGIVFPGSGLALGHAEASRVLLGVSACVAVPLYIALLARAFRGPALPQPLRPTWFILLVPPSLVGAHGAALFPEAAVLAYLYLGALAVLAAVLWYARGLPRWPFSPVWWSLTFPLDALAYAAARYAQGNPSEPLWRLAAGGTLLLATLVVSLVFLKNLHFLFATPRNAASPAA